MSTTLKIGVPNSQRVAGNARVAGLQRDLKLTDHQYQVAVTVTYVYVPPYYEENLLTYDSYRPYIVAELPANLLLRRIGPKIVMPALLVVWGMITTLEGEMISALLIHSK